MIARADTRQEAIAALERQKARYRKAGSTDTREFRRVNGNPAEELGAIQSRIEIIRGLG